MPIPLTLTPGGPVLHCPTKWADVTLAQFISIYAPVPGDERTAVEILLGLEAGGLGQLPAAQVPIVAALLEFVADTSPVLGLPTSSELPDVGALPYACIQLVQQRFEANADRAELASLAYVLGVYRSQLAFGNTNHADRLEQELLAAPVTECYADGAFFLTGSWHLVTGTAPSPKTLPTLPTRKSKPAPKSWLRSLGLRFRWTPSPEATS